MWNICYKETSKIEIEQIPPTINIYTSFISSMFEELRLVVCLDNP